MWGGKKWGSKSKKKKKKRKGGLSSVFLLTLLPYWNFLSISLKVAVLHRLIINRRSQDSRKAGSEK